MFIQKWSIVWCMIFASFVSACAANDTKVTAAVNGSVRGQAFAGSAADFDTLTEGELLIAIADAGGICQYAAASDGGAAPSFDIQWLSVMTCSGTMELTGQYEIRADYQQASDVCEPKMAGVEIRRFVGGVATQVPADSGTLTISAFSDQSLKGSLTVNFGTEAVTGEFTAGYCASLNH